MPLSLSRRQISPAWGCNLETVSRRLKGLPVSYRPTGGRGKPQHIYQLAAVLPRVTRPENIGPLFRATTDDSSLYVGTGPEIMEMAERLEAWLTPAMRSRYARVKAAMLAGLASTPGGAAFLPLIETLNRKALLHSDLLRHVVLGLPNQIAFGAFAPAFALVNAAAEPEPDEWQVAA